MLLQYDLAGQCNSDYSKAQSNKIANYDIKVVLDAENKIAVCKQILVWKNTSPDTLKELRFYMYMNAFKNKTSTYLKGSNTVFRQKMDQKPEKEWGYITITSFKTQDGIELSERQQYIHPDDNNLEDESVLSVILEKPILPYQQVKYNIDFTVKLPKTIVRSGYGKNDFFLFVHWFPQIGVYQPTQSGKWQWNCHQFMKGTEFYADFGDYSVEIDAPDHLVIGGSGCIIDKSETAGRQYITFEGHDLIDFGWTAYPDYDVYTTVHNGVDIEILMPPEHCKFADRYLDAVTHGLDYMTAHVGAYPYPKITIVDPPVHSLNSGFMEYPMMITGASFYGIPRSVRSVESLVIHEFNHMYFMATLATNEKETPWLDEGFVTYFEDRVTDHFHGDKRSLFNLLGFRSGNAEQTRLEYLSLPHTTTGPIARPGWEVKTNYKPLIYGKTATMLKTLEGIVTIEVMDEIIKSYFAKYKFTHPTEEDFRSVVKQTLTNHPLPNKFDDDYFFDELLHGTSTLDYEVIDIQNVRIEDNENGAKWNCKIELNNNGKLVLGTQFLTKFENGIELPTYWDGNGQFVYEFTSGTPIETVEIDPEHKIFLDLNFNNNGKTYSPNKKPLIKYASKATNWIQTIYELASFLL